MYEQAIVKRSNPAYLGDGASNMANSLMLALQLAGVNMVIAAPEEYKPRQDDGKNNGSVKGPGQSASGKRCRTPICLYGCLGQHGLRRRVQASHGNSQTVSVKHGSAQAGKAGYQSPASLSRTPRRRDHGLSHGISESNCFLDQAENRLHVQKAIMSLLIKESHLRDEHT
ncbi:MAG: hypothetical protein V8T87_05195 [Victivallales bacterium]